MSESGRDTDEIIHSRNASASIVLVPSGIDTCPVFPRGHLNRCSPFFEYKIPSITVNDCGLGLTSIQAHNLNICRGFFTGGESIINYLKSLDIDLFLTANDDSAKAAIDNGIPAATMITSAAKYMTESTELRVAFDGDAVLFGDESEAIFKAEGLEAFGKNESEKANIPMKEGPMAKFLRALAKIQTKQEKEGKNNETKIVTALVTARSAPAHARTIKTLRAWGIKVNQAFFLGGLDKTYVLKEFKPQIFFDDQHVHTDRASLVVPAGTVPYKSDSVLAKPKEEEKKGEK